MMVALISLFFLLGIGDPDCSRDGYNEAREVHREMLKQQDELAQELQRTRGGMSDEAIDLRDEIREKRDQLTQWARACGQKWLRKRE